jgi:hypothetical protein
MLCSVNVGLQDPNSSNSDLPVNLKRISAFLFSIVIFGVGLATAGDFEDALAALKRNDYATALRLWRPLAERGHAGAQTGLGVMYAKGLGVSQDYQTAI